jgi:phosphoribulokinase
MVVVYNGSEDWEGEIWFHDLFPDLPDELRQYVPQFKLFFINLRRMPDVNTYNPSMY